MKKLITALMTPLAAVFALSPAIACAGNLVLKASPSDGDGRITVGDVFDNAGAQANVLLGYRQGATAVLDAGTVQAVAANNGAVWDNPRGLRRIIVTSGIDGSALEAEPVAAMAAPAQRGGKTVEVLVFAHSMNAGDILQAEDMSYAQVQAANGDIPGDARAVVGKMVRFPVREGAVVHTSALSSPTVIKRSENVKVTWAAHGLSVSVNGIAQKDAAAGDLIQIQNPTSKKMIDAVVVGPGEALAGPAADQMRSRMLLSSR